jgi:hypothetical protein
MVAPGQSYIYGAPQCKYYIPKKEIAVKYVTKKKAIQNNMGFFRCQKMDKCKKVPVIRIPKTLHLFFISTFSQRYFINRIRIYLSALSFIEFLYQK